jgi:cysteine-rich repeat protein
LNEECDDGNIFGGDGCSGNCTFEYCGNGELELLEECDDGNTISGDDCSSECFIEVCGNGRLDFRE